MLDPAFMSGEIWSHYLYNIVIWAPGKPADIEDHVRKALAGVDPSLVLYGVDSYPKVVSADFQQQNLIAALTTLFGALGLILAAVGLYGVLAYTVERRTGEIGVRMALGAAPGGVFGLMIGYGLRLSATGIAAGLAAALLLTRGMATMLIGTKPADPLSFAAMALLFFFIALLATWVPARRAAALDPSVALREE